MILNLTFSDEPELNVYSFNLFTSEFCDLLVSRFKLYQSEIKDNPLINNKSSLSCEYIPSLSWLRTFILHFISKPLTPHLFKIEDSKLNLNWSQSYIASYIKFPGEGERKGLIEHTDDSEVTCNLCLSDSYTGGELIFGPMRGKEDGDMNSIDLVKGGITLHYGRQLHSVGNVEDGERFVLITWCRDEKWRENVW